MSNAILRPPSTVAQTLTRVRKLLAENQSVSAEVELHALLERQPGVVEAWLLMADLAEQRGEGERAAACLAQALSLAPHDNALALAVAHKQMVSGYPDATIDSTGAVLAREPHNVVAWIMLGDALRMVGQEELALRAHHQGVLRGQASGQLLNQETTPAVLKPVIGGIIAEIRTQMRSRIEGALEAATAQFSADALARVRHALAVYHGSVPDEVPASEHQRPYFLYVPGLPAGPFHDPALQPWLARLLAGLNDIRSEAQAMLAAMGSTPKDAPQAYFFHRAGQRNPAAATLYPKTAALLPNLNSGAAPEAFFSTLPAGVHTPPAHASSNARLVLQLPVIVPPGCTLDVDGNPAHAWKEGEPVLFDPTWRHALHNPSGQPLVMLEVDCWNPHLSGPEQQALAHVFDTINDYKTFPFNDLHALAQQLRDDAAAAPEA